jgi:hypothetical protein
MPAPKISQTRAKKYLTSGQLRERWGNCSHMFIQRRIKSDPLMPRPKRFGGSRIRFFDIEEIEAYERLGVAAPGGVA